MTIGEIAVVRTGLVTARRKKDASSSRTFDYRLLNLKCIANEGYIEKAYIEPYELSEELKEDYLTRMEDILIRLSAPYTVVMIDQPDATVEKQILHLVRGEISGAESALKAEISVDDVLAARDEALRMHMSERVEEYLVQLVMATRNPEKYNAALKGKVAYGASPRATLALDRCSKVHAWLKGKDFVAPEDLHAVVYDILRHRIILSFEAQAEGLTTDDVISSLLKLVPLP